MNAPSRFVLRAAGAGPELVRLAAGDDFTVGRDARARAQIGHGSIAPFHARLRCDDWGVWITPLSGSAVAIAGERVQGERLIPLGKPVEIGALTFELAPDEVVPTTVAPTGLRRVLGQATTMLFSAAFHLAVIWILRELAVVAVDEESTILGLRSESIVGPSELLEPTVEPVPVEPLPEPEEPAELDALDAPLEVDPGAAPGDRPDVESGLESSELSRAAGLGASAGGGISGEGTLSLTDATGLSSAFVTRLRSLRGSGVDLVVVIDATSSMRPFIEDARVAAGRLVSTLATVVSDLRVGVVAYRDEGDDFVTRELPLSGDRYAILNFLWDLEADGGGDLPEAVAAGIEAAIAQPWRPRTHRVIVVVGDAPPHASDLSRMKGRIARFIAPDRIPGAVVSAIYTGAAGEAADRRDDGAAALAEIARLGRGDFLDLANGVSVGERLLLLTLGPRHAGELKVLLSRVKEGPREQLLKKRVAARDREWLLGKLQVQPVHPGVVEALVDLADREVLGELLRIVLDARRPLEVRQAALFVLRRCLPAARELDLSKPASAQKFVVERLEAMIERR